MDDGGSVGELSAMCGLLGGGYVWGCGYKIGRTAYGGSLPNLGNVHAEILAAVFDRMDWREGPDGA